MHELRRFFPIFIPHRKRAVLLMAVLLASSGLTVVTPFFYQMLVDAGIYGRSLPVIAGSVALVAAAMLAKEGLFLLQTRITLRMRESVFAAIKEQVYVHLMGMSPRYFAERNKGRLLNRLIADVNTLQSLFLDQLVFFVRDLLVGLFILGIMLAIEWRMVVAAAFFLPLFYVIYQLFRRRITVRSEEMYEQRERLTERWQEDLSAVQELQAYSVVPERARGTVGRIQAAEGARRRLEMTWAAASSSTVAIQLAGLVVIWGMGAREVLAGSMTIGVLIALSFFLSHIIQLFYSAYYILMDYRSAVPAARNVLELLDVLPEVADKRGATRRDFRGAVLRMEGVSFGYVPDKPLLTDVNLTFKPGETIGLIGASGEGKTTLIRLLQRLMDPDAGRITLDGTDLRDVQLAALRRAVAVIPQDNVLLDDTLRNNILFHRNGIDEDRFRRACRLARVNRFAEGLSDGYDTLIGERGAKLSEGQKKRVAIARALLDDPCVLVLDEATAMLDEDAEQDILSSLARPAADRIVILITHKTANLQYVDRVIRMDGGRVAEEVSGRHGQGPGTT